MMAQPSYAPAVNPVSVIGPQFSVPYLIDIVVTKSPTFLAGGNFVITDLNDNVMLKVKSCNSNFHDQRLLVDAYENPIAILREKIRSEHCRWQVFRGGSNDLSDLIFSTKTLHMIQFKTKLNVYLGRNRKEDYPDFMIEGSWTDKSCTVTAGSSSTIIAQMHKRHPRGHVLGKDRFLVTVYPGIDYAFVVALIAIVDAMKDSNSEEDLATGAATGAVIGAIIAS